jgi:hypothetical protein
MKTYGLAMLACLGISGLAYADGTQTFDFSLDIVPAGLHTPLEFTGMLTFDSSTGQLISGSSGSFTNFISSPLGSVGEASASIQTGSSPADSDTLTFGWLDPLGIAEVTPITFGRYVDAANPGQDATCSNTGSSVCFGSHLIRESAMAAPEIDVNSAPGALMILAGFIAVVRGRQALRPK